MRTVRTFFLVDGVKSAVVRTFYVVGPTFHLSDDIQGSTVRTSECINDLRSEMNRSENVSNGIELAISGTRSSTRGRESENDVTPKRRKPHF